MANSQGTIIYAANAKKGPMPNAIPVNKKLSARKKPSQDRSQRMVARILEATRELLREAGGVNSPRITTKHIAEKAGISVGSLYQYFPNLSAVLFALYEEVLDRVRQVLDRYDSVEYISLPRDEFFSRLNRALADAGPDKEIVVAMVNAIRTDPDLAEAERRHAEQTSKRIAKLLQHFGSSWPLEKLQRLVLYLYYLDHGGWAYREHVNPPAQETLNWEVSALNHLMMQCFD